MRLRRSALVVLIVVAAGCGIPRDPEGTLDHVDSELKGPED